MGKAGGEAMGPFTLTLTVTATPSFSSRRWQAPTRQCRSLRYGGALEPYPLPLELDQLTVALRHAAAFALLAPIPPHPIPTQPPPPPPHHCHPPTRLRSTHGCASALQVRAIANVAFDPEQAKVVFAAGAVASVVSLLSSGSVRVQLQALCALRNLTADAPAAFDVVAHGAIAQLVTLLCSDSQQVQVQAVWVVGALALHEEANLQLVSAGVLPLLEALKYSTDTEARDAASQALGNLARVLTPNSRRVIEQDTVQLDRGGRAGGRNRRQSPLARAANATSVVWTSPLAGES